MNNNDNNKQQQMQIELPQEVAQGVYSNLAIISHSSAEFVIDFAALVPGVPKATVRSRVMLAPEHVKRLMQALNENIMRYEQEFGKIQMPAQHPRTIAPFNVGNKGEA